MKNVYLTRPRLGVAVIALGALTVAAACAPKIGQRQTQVMQRSGKVSVSAAELRARVNDLADRFMGRLEEAADRIAADSPDRNVDRQALAFKIDAVPSVYTAAYRVDPLAAAMDVWALAFQLRRYVDAGPGGKIFGAQQPLAKDMAGDLLASAPRTTNGPEPGSKTGLRLTPSNTRFRRGHRTRPALPACAPTSGTRSWRSARQPTRSRACRNA